ncbi:hypothetical protein [Amycolatopsis sp. MEPSY49]|uniref:hypothetical protein n=1 Tax=Amycolatopsis sp. MEPSY49 TaxID=3151600 RepID=UPI003EF0C6B4
MTAPSLAESAFAMGSRIGRYFGIVSMLPALFLVLWSAALIAAGAWTGGPQLKQLGSDFGQLTLAKVAWILLLSLVTGLFLHPLQFAMTQVLEGYWGHSKVARTLALVKIDRYRKKQRELENRRENVSSQLREIVDARLESMGEGSPNSWDPVTYEKKRRSLLNSRRANDLTAWVLALDALGYATERFPDPARLMPTRLGNALRREEDRAGRQYGLDAVVTAPHFALIADERHVQYLRDARQQLDTSVRLCVVSALATLETVACLVTDGWWLFIGLATYGLTYLAYRASVSAADEYTTALRTLIDLNRFKFYESLRIRHPRSSAEERSTNTRLMDLLRGKREDLSYQPPTAANPPPAATPPGNP